MLRRSRFPAIAAALVAAVIMLGLAAGAGWTQSADWQVSNSLAIRVDERDPAFISFMQWASWIGGGTPRWVIVILLCGLVWHWCGPRCAVALGGASLLSNLASSLLKLGFGRARPDVIDHLDPQTSFSYPSGHATSAAVVYLLLAWLAPRRWRPYAWALAATMIVLNGFSRIMLGVHWASDIAGGTMLGTAFAMLGAWWVAKHRTPA